MTKVQCYAGAMKRINVVSYREPDIPGCLVEVEAVQTGEAWNVRGAEPPEELYRRHFDDPETAVQSLAELLTDRQYTEARTRVCESGESFACPEIVRELPFLNLWLFKRNFTD